MSLFRLFFSIFMAFGFVITGPAMAAYTHHHPNKAVVTHTLTQQIDVNSADAQTLATLKGIGTKKAQAIVDYRNKNGAFKSVADLTNVKGIGSQFLARLEKNNPGIMTAKPIA